MDGKVYVIYYVGIICLPVILQRIK